MPTRRSDFTDILAQLQMQQMRERSDPFSTNPLPPSPREPLRKPDSFLPPQSFLQWLGGGIPQISDPLTGQPNEPEVQQSLAEAIMGGFGGAAVDTVLSGAKLLNPQVKSGVAPIFGGAGAKTAPLGQLDLAKELDANDFSREQIWESTGWFRGVDGEWRFEIPDDASAMIKGSEGFPRQSV